MGWPLRSLDPSTLHVSIQRERIVLTKDVKKHCPLQLQFQCTELGSDENLANRPKQRMLK